ncbi:MAG: YqhA family protein [Anaerolineae bacterium]|jgi:uncharacterized membrane protein YqhA
MLQAFFRIRYMVVLAVVAALLGALLLILLGGWHTIEGFLLFVGLQTPKVAGNASLETVVKVIEALDSFLLAFVLLVFAYSTYFLFVHEEVDEERQKRIRMPTWLQVEDLDDMKQVLLRVIMVLLSVYLLQLVFVEGTNLAWTTLILPASIVAIAVSLKLVYSD